MSSSGSFGLQIILCPVLSNSNIVWAGFLSSLLSWCQLKCCLCSNNDRNIFLVVLSFEGVGIAPFYLKFSTYTTLCKSLQTVAHEVYYSSLNETERVGSWYPRVRQLVSSLRDLFVLLHGFKRILNLFGCSYQRAIQSVSFVENSSFLHCVRWVLSLLWRWVNILDINHI